MPRRLDISFVLVRTCSRRCLHLELGSIHRLHRHQPEHRLGAAPQNILLARGQHHLAGHRRALGDDHHAVHLKSLAAWKRSARPSAGSFGTSSIRVISSGMPPATGVVRAAAEGAAATIAGAGAAGLPGAAGLRMASITAAGTSAFDSLIISCVERSNLVFDARMWPMITAAATSSPTMSMMLWLVSTPGAFRSAPGASGVLGAAGAGEVPMDSPGISTPRCVTRTFFERPHVRQYRKLSPMAIQIHLLCRRRGRPTGGAPTGVGASEESRGGCHVGACDTGLPSGGVRPGLLIAPESNFAFCAASTVYITCVLCQRSLGSLRSASVMISTTSGGTSGTSSAMGLTSSRRIAVSVVIAESPENALLPVSISYITTPNEKMSLRASTFLPCACSGDM